MGYRETVFHAVAGSRVVCRVIDLFVYNGLDRRVLGGVDLKTAAVEQVVCLGLGVAELLH